MTIQDHIDNLTGLIDGETQDGLGQILEPIRELLIDLNEGNAGIEPGTQSPLEVIYVVSKTEPTPNATGYSPEKLADLFEGTRQNGRRSVQDEYALFTDRTSADNYAKRQGDLSKALMHLRKMDASQLAEVSEALGDPERLIEGINHYCE